MRRRTSLVSNALQARSRFLSPAIRTRRCRALSSASIMFSLVLFARFVPTVNNWIGIEAEPTEQFVAAEVIDPQPVLGLWTSRGQTDAFGNPIPTTLISESIAPNTVVRATLESTSSYGNFSVLTGDQDIRVVCGRAAFTDLVVQKVGRFKLVFSAEYLSAHTVNQTREFDVVPGAPFALKMAQAPNGFRLQRAFQQQPILEIHDRGGNIVTDSGLTVVCSVLLPTVGVLIWSDSTGLPAEMGIADFERITCTFCIGTTQGLALSTVVAGARLRFSAAGISSVDTESFDVSSWPPDGIIITQAPDIAYAGRPFAVQPSVYQIDNTGYLITWEPDPISQIEVQIRSRPGTIESLQGAARADLKRGFATFTDLQLDFANQAYALDFVYISATFVDVQPRLSPLFNVIFGEAASLGMGQTFGAPSLDGAQPSGARPGSPMAQQPVVVVQDVASNWVRNVSLGITVELLRNGTVVDDAGLAASSAGFRSCPLAEGEYQCAACNSLVADCGIFTFSGLRVDSAGTGFQLKFSSGQLQPVLSLPLDIENGAPFALLLLQQPRGFRVDSASQVQPHVEVVDEGNNRIAGAQLTVVPTLCAHDLSQFPQLTPDANNQSSECQVGNNLTALFLQARAQATTDGVARFTNLAITTTGLGFRILFCSNSDSIRCVSSSPFNVTFTPIQLVILAHPSSAVAGRSFGRMPTVSVADLQGVAAPWTPRDFLAVTCSVCILEGHNATAAWSCGEHAATGGQDVVSCPPAESPPPALDGVIPDVNLKGHLSEPAVDGIAVFTELSIDRAGAYKMLFRSGGLEVAESERFVVERGEPARIQILRHVEGTRPGFPFDVQPVVALQDRGGNLIATDSSTIVTAALLVGAETVEAIPVYIHRQPAEVAVEEGLAWFQGLGVAMSGRSYQILYTATLSTGDGVSVTSDAFFLTPGLPSRLVVTSLPARCSLLTPSSDSICQDQPVVSVADQAGNVVTTATATVEGSVWQSMTAAGPLVVFRTDAVYGVATFTNFSSPVAGSELMFRFKSRGLEATEIADFEVAAAPSLLRLIGKGPGRGEAGFPVSIQPVIAIEDAAGRLVDADTAVTVTASITSFPSCPSPCVLDGTEDFLSGESLLRQVVAAPVGGDKDVAAQHGFVTFSDLQINARAQCFVMVFSAAGLTPTASLPFSVTSGVHRVVVVTTQPFGAVPGQELSVQPAIAVHDAGGNLRQEDSDTIVTASLLGRPLSDLLGGSNKVVRVSEGRAHFQSLRIDVAFPCLLFAFSAVGRDPGFSVSFEVLPLAPVRLTFHPESTPAGPAPGEVLARQPGLVVEDSFGNLGNPRAGELWVHVILLQGGERTDCGVDGVCLLGNSRATFERAGVAAFTDLRIDKMNTNGANYSLLFTAEGLDSVESARDLVVRTSTVVVGLGIVSEPDGFKADETFLRDTVVGVVDAGGNVVVDSFPSTISLVLEGGGSDRPILSGTTIVLTENGVAQFSDLLVNRTVGNLTLYFSAFAVGLGFVRTTPFDVAAETASLQVLVQPVGARAGMTFSVLPVLQAKDAQQLLVTAIGSVGGRCAQCIVAELLEDSQLLQGNTTARYRRGSAMFTDFRIDTAGTYRIRFFADNNVSNISTSVHIVNQNPASLRLVQDPTPVEAGAPLGQQPVLEVLDPFGNLVLDRSVAVTAQLQQYAGAGACEASSCEVPMLGVEVASSEAGVVNFTSAGLGVVNAGEAFFFVFSADELPSVSSAPFAVETAAPFRLKFTQVPENFYFGEILTPIPSLLLEDAGGNIIAANQSVSVSLHNMSGCQNTSQGPASFEKGSSVRPCGVVAEGLTIIQPWCVAEQVRDDASEYCAAILDANASVGSGPLYPQAGSWPEHPSRVGFIVDWVLNSSINLTFIEIQQVATIEGQQTIGNTTYVNYAILNFTLFEVRFNASFATNETEVYANCVGHANISRLINGTLGQYSQQDLRRLLGDNRTAHYFDFGPRFDLSLGENTTSNASNTTMNSDTTQSVIVSHTCIKYNLSETLVTREAVFPGLAIQGPGVQLKLRFTLFNCVLIDGAVDSLCASQARPEDAIVLETSSFEVSGFPMRLTALTWPAQTGTGGNAFELQPSFVITDSEGRIFTKLSGITVSATVLADDGLSQCSLATPHRCPSPTTVCVVRPEQCPRLLGQGRRRQTLGRVHFTDLSISTCNDVSIESFICLFGEYRVSFVAEGVVRFPNTTNVSISLPLQVSPMIAIDLGPAAQLLISVFPDAGSARAGAALITQPELYMLDAGGNRALDEGVRVRADALINNTNVTASALAGTIELASFKGSVKFTDLALLIADSAFELSFSAGPTTVVRSSASLQVLPGAAVRVVVDQEPHGAFGGEAFQSQPQLSVRDAWNNVAWLETHNVSARLAPWSLEQGGALCQGECHPGQNKEFVVQTELGMANFSSLGIDAVGSCYVLLFSAQTLYSATSSPLSVEAGPPSQLVVFRQPNGARPGIALADQPSICLCDRGGNAVPYNRDRVVASATRQGVSLPIDGTRLERAVNGLVTFTDLTLMSADNGTTLTFTRFVGGMAPVTSQPLLVRPGQPHSLRVMREARDPVVGSLLPIQPLVRVEDAGGNLVSDSSDVIVTVQLLQHGIPSLLAAHGPSCTSIECVLPCFAPLPCPTASMRCPSCLPRDSRGFTLQTNGTDEQYREISENVQEEGVTVLRTVFGYANFSELALETAGVDFHLRFTSFPLRWADSAQRLSVAPGNAWKLGFVRRPAGFQSDTPFRIQPVLQVQDSGSNRLFVSEGTMLALLWGPGPAGSANGTILRPARNLVVPIVAGEAQFVNLRINRAGDGLSLLFTSTVCFDIIPKTAVQNITERPLAANSSSSSNSSNSSNSSSTPASLLSAVDDVETNKMLLRQALSQQERWYQISSGCMPAYTGHFAVTDKPTTMSVTRTPGTSVIGQPLVRQPIVSILDDSGRLVDYESGRRVVRVSVVADASREPAALGGILKVVCCSGLCPFTDLWIDRGQAGYRLVFSSPPFADVLSDAFDVVGPSRLALSQQPWGGLTTRPFPVQPWVVITDEWGGRIAVNVTVTASLRGGSQRSGTNLFGNVVANASNGEARFTDLFVDRVGSRFVLEFESNALKGASSKEFQVDAAIRPNTCPLEGTCSAG